MKQATGRFDHVLKSCEGNGLAAWLVMTGNPNVELKGILKELFVNDGASQISTWAQGGTPPPFHWPDSAPRLVVEEALLWNLMKAYDFESTARTWSHCRDRASTDLKGDVAAW